MSLTGVATAIDHFMKAGPGVFWVLVCGVLIAIPVTLLHELGHAVVARARLGSAVQVTVGNAGRIGTVRLGQLTTTFHAFQTPTRMGGTARFDALRATASDILWISLAGPAASLAGGVLAVIAYQHAPTRGAVHALLWVAVFASVFAVANVFPLRLRQRRGGPAFNTDGMVALTAVAMMITGRSRQAAPPSRRAPGTASPPEPGQLGVKVRRQDHHVQIGVGTSQAFEARTAVIVALSPSAARGLARVILELSDEAEHAVAAELADALPDSSPATALSSSTAPPGFNG